MKRFRTNFLYAISPRFFTILILYLHSSAGLSERRLLLPFLFDFSYPFCLEFSVSRKAVLPECFLAVIQIPFPDCRFGGRIDIVGIKRNFQSLDQSLGDV
jgi:hypothetical protein